MTMPRLARKIPNTEPEPAETEMTEEEQALSTLRRNAEVSLCGKCKAPLYPYGMGLFPAGFGCKACDGHRPNRNWTDHPVKPSELELACRYALERLG